MIAGACMDAPEPAVSSPPGAVTRSAPAYTFEVLGTFPHDPAAFTQGLAYRDDALYEGTGLSGSSTLREVELETGRVIRLRELESDFFGEGITVYADWIVQLSWRSGVGFVWSRESFELINRFSYKTEGWGITNDGRRLIMSDGSSRLYVLDAENNFRQEIFLEVTDDDGPVTGLNELEWVEGELFANVWPTGYIAVISPSTGRVSRWLDMRGLVKEAELGGAVDVLNGIAYDSHLKRLFVTGKLWPSLFEIRIVSSG